MGLHQDIRVACAEAAPGIARAAEGSEASIANLPAYVADLMVTLVRYGNVVDALKARGIDVAVAVRVPNKRA